MPESEDYSEHTRGTHTLMLVFYVIGIIIGLVVISIVLGQIK